MVRIRLRRVGSKKQPSYRVVAADKEAPRDGRFLEILGHYNPRTRPGTIHFQEDRIYHWLSVGAQPSESVVKLFNIVGLMARYERFKAGEDIETLLKEAAESEASRGVNPKTRYDTSVAKKPADEKAKEKTAKKTEKKADKKAEESTVAEVEPSGEE
ncbi:MAG: 30S ribosomal protein S16 [Anaerolineales bacterium]|nr:30S ribosomal protein S16 [Anaerolineales bacterium]HEY62756.1 30S ribosomal protein S16 [Anaerolineae bacterium]